MTISASYGAGGSVVAPALAAALDVRFLDRGMSAGDVQRLSEGAADTERTAGLWERMLRALALVPEETAVATPPPPTASADDRLRAEAEATLTRFAASGGGVSLGRAGAAVLPGAYHVRLHGPVDRRLKQGMAIEGLAEEDARRRLEEADKVRELYWRRLYRQDWNDPALYHLAIDSTALPLDTVTEVIALAVRAYWRH